MWGLPEHLLALLVDALHVANWQRSSDGSKGRNYPEPIPPRCRAKDGRSRRSAAGRDGRVARMGKELTRGR